jgi:hypothetical protein
MATIKLEDVNKDSLDRYLATNTDGIIRVQMPEMKSFDIETYCSDDCVKMPTLLKSDNEIVFDLLTHYQVLAQLKEQESLAFIDETGIDDSDIELVMPLDVG